MEVLQETYKDTKIGRSPKDWELLSVEKCILKKKFSVGKLPKKDYFKEGRFPIIDQSKTFIIGYSSHSELLYNGNLPAIIYGDHTNHVKYISFPFICGADGVKIIQPLDELDNKFVYYSILYRKPQSEGYKRHFSILKEKHLCIPPLPEQQKIVAILSTVDEQISTTDKIIEKSKDLKKGLMQKLFSEGIGHTEFKDTKIGRIPKDWDLEKLNKNVLKVGSGVTPKGGSSVYLMEGIPLIRSQNVLYGKLQLNGVACIDELQYKKMKNSQLQENDVLLNISGASIGRSGVVFKNILPANVNQHVCIIRTTERINASYLSTYLISNGGQNQIFRLQAGGNREGLNFQHIRSFKIPLPPVSEQQKIAAIFSEADAKIEKEQNQKSQLKALKKGLMQQLLTGKKRVKV